MGAWGNEPTDSDQGADFMAEALRGVPARVRRGLADEDMMVVRAAAVIVQQLGFTYVWPAGVDDLDETLEMAVSRLEAVRDGEQPDAWADPSAVRRSIDRQIVGLRKRLQDTSYPGTRTDVARCGDA